MEIASKLVHSQPAAGGSTGSKLHQVICRLLGEEIRRCRVNGGWSVADVSRATGLTPTALSNLELGRGFRVTTLYRVATALDVDIEFLMPTLAAVAEAMDAV